MFDDSFDVHRFKVSNNHNNIAATIMGDCVFLSCHIRVLKRIYALQLPECQGVPYSKQAQNLKFKWLHRNWAHNHLVCKITLNYLAKLAKLAKWLNACLGTKWLWVWIPMQSQMIFLSTFWLHHGPLWVTVEGAFSLTPY